MALGGAAAAAAEGASHRKAQLGAAESCRSEFFSPRGSLGLPPVQCRAALPTDRLRGPMRPARVYLRQTGHWPVLTHLSRLGFTSPYLPPSRSRSLALSHWLALVAGLSLTRRLCRLGRLDLPSRRLLLERLYLHLASAGGRAESSPTIIVTTARGGRIAEVTAEIQFFCLAAHAIQPGRPRQRLGRPGRSLALAKRHTNLDGWPFLIARNPCKLGAKLAR